MTDDEIKTIAARAEAATPGPWATERSGIWAVGNDERDALTIVVTDGGFYPPDINDAAFIAASRSDVPALCTELLAARAEIERLKEDREIALSLSGSFFMALKPLNLPAINVQEPGVHVTALIRERDEALAEIERLEAQVNAYRVAVQAHDWKGMEAEHERDAALAELRDLVEALESHGGTVMAAVGFKARPSERHFHQDLLDCYDMLATARVLLSPPTEAT